MTQPPPDRIARFTALSERFPTSEVPRFSLAQAYIEAGRTDDAIRTLREVIALRADFLMAWVDLARLLVRAEQWSEARPAAEEALRLATTQNHSAPRIEAEALLEEIEREEG